MGRTAGYGLASNGIIKCQDGLIMDATLRPSGWGWLEHHYGMRLSQINERWHRQGGIDVEGGRAVVTALILQQNSTMTDDQARKAVLDHEMELLGALLKLGSIGFELQDSGSIPPGTDKMEFMGVPLKRNAEGEWEIDESGHLRKMVAEWTPAA